MKQMALMSIVLVFAACGSCSDVDKKGDPFPTTEGDAGDMGEPGDDMSRPRDTAPDGPTLSVQPDELVFSGIPSGASAEQAFTVSNVGSGVLELSGITLVESTSADGTEFEAANQWTGLASLEAGDSLTFSVRYTPMNDEPDEGYVELRANDPGIEDGLFRVQLRSTLSEPQIDVIPEAVTFGRVPPVNANTRDQVWEVIEVLNSGGAPLEIADILITPADAPFSISFPTDANSPPSTDSDAPPSSLDPGNGSMPVRIFFNPTDTLPASAELVFFTNDPDSPETVVELAGNVGSPCVELSEETEIDFGAGAVGFTSTRTLIIDNCSSVADLTISSFATCTDDATGNCNAGGVFDVEAGTLAGVIAPGDSATLVTSFSPTALTVSTGLLTLDTDDPARPVIELPLRGEGTDGNACPQAVAEARASGTTTYSTNVNTLPLETVELRGTNSTDPDGIVVSYEWTILQRPVGSTAVLTPSNDVATPQMFLDLAGSYLIELQVTDDDNTVSCGTQALVRIDAVPNEDIHVQLVWDTPADANQTDANGTDLDLHFLHPNGAWNSAPWDVYWLNPTAEWGAVGPADDPSLDIDDTDGAGPENINLNSPESGTAYAVGAYYYADKGFGPSYATVRIYIGGALAYEHRDQYLETITTFWHAANVAWPSGAVTAVNQITTGFP